MGNIRVNLYLDEDYHTVIQNEIGRQHISEFFRMVEEEFFNSPEYDGLSIRLRAREIASNVRAKIMQQRKLTEEKESFKEREARQAKEREYQIAMSVLHHVEKQKFTPTNLPEHDDQWTTSEGIRKRLVDEVSSECQMDLQWKDIEKFVRKAVIAE